MKKKIISVLSALFLVVFLSGMVLGEPNFTTIPQNESIDYGLNWDGVQFSVDNDTNVTWSVNDQSNFNISSNGFLDTTKNLGADNYSVQVTANKTNGGQNSTIYVLTVNRVQPGLTLTSNKGWTVEEGTQVTITGGSCPSQLECNLYNESGNVSNPYTNTLGEGSYTFEFNTTGNENYTARTLTQTLNVESTFCEVGNPGKLKLSIESVDVVEGFGDNEEYWYPLDDIEIEIEVENEKDYEVKDIEIKACLYDVEDDSCVLDEEDMDLSEDDFDLEDESIKSTLSFSLDPDDLDAGNTNYIFKVRATGTVDDSEEAENAGIADNDTCIAKTSEDEEFDSGWEIRTDEPFVIVDNIDFKEGLACGEEFDFSAEVWNIDDSDIEDDEIFINIFSDELGINENIDFRDISSFDMERLESTFTVPEDTEEGTYRIYVRVFDDEDMNDGDLYENSEEDESIFSKILEVNDCEGERNVSIRASLASDPEEVIAGNTIKIDVTLTNTGEEETEYALQLIENRGFSRVKNMSNPTLRLAPGESGESTINLELNKDAEGREQFDLEVIFGDKKSTQTLELDIEPGFRLFNLGDNLFIIAIAVANLVLIIAIIVVAIRMSRR